MGRVPTSYAKAGEGITGRVVANTVNGTISGRELGGGVEAVDLAGPQPSSTAEWIRLLDAGGALVGLGTPQRPSGFLHPEVVLI